VSTDRHTPFYCGSQRADWKCYNCDFCTKRYDENAMVWRCDLEKQIDSAYMGDGSMTAETARRMGEPDDCCVHNWRCPEFVEDSAERAHAAAWQKAREAAKRAYENRNRPAPWIESWLSTKKAKEAKP